MINGLKLAMFIDKFVNESLPVWPIGPIEPGGPFDGGLKEVQDRSEFSF
jgi:hypothetical protein